MKNSKKFTNIILSILLVVTIILAALSGIVRFAATNKAVYLNLLEESNTYSIVEEALSNKMAAILGDDISENLKKSIIKEEDIRKEADVVLDCVISNLISGQVVLPQIDTEIYKERVADALKSLTGFEVESNNDNNLTSSIQFNDVYLTSINVLEKNDRLINENMFNAGNLNNNKNNNFVLVNMASRAELEAKGRALLRENGLTEEEARRKAAERGISEKDVWNYLEYNGYLDEESESEDSLDIDSPNYDTYGNPEDSSNAPSSNASNDVLSESGQADNYNKDNESKVSKKKIQEIVTSVLMDDNKNFDEKVNEISLRLMEEAEKIIDAEMEKLNFSKVINSNEFKAAIKITSILYNNFYILLLIIAVICLLILFINKVSIFDGAVIIGKSVFISGIIMSLAFGGIYLSKVYTHIDINLNKVYFESMFLVSAEYFSRLLCIVSIIILLVGLTAYIFMMKKKLTGR
ncbi:hypothetical protein [uncultured Clostridium sp.]|uniref:hypothetical protein n=1 Tax=uncultured Clostridium sp. TaxID=59620 RepID=UPI0025F22891|nr:hypothetical protein [uncultured Clostridium sp.]